MMNNRWRRWSALQLASWLPDNLDDADAILRMAREIYYQTRKLDRPQAIPQTSKGKAIIPAFCPPLTRGRAAGRDWPADGGHIHEN